MKYILAFETSFAFTPITILWAWGLYGVPGFIQDTIQGEGLYRRLLVAILFGLFGVVGVIMTSATLIKDRKGVKLNIVNAFFLVLGISGLLLGLPGQFSLDPMSLLFFWTPLLVGIHLLFLIAKQLTSASAGAGR